MKKCAQFGYTFKIALKIETIYLTFISEAYLEVTPML